MPIASITPDKSGKLKSRVEILAIAYEAMDNHDVEAMQKWLDKYAEKFPNTAERVRKAMEG